MINWWRTSPHALETVDDDTSLGGVCDSHTHLLAVALNGLTRLDILNLMIYEVRIGSIKKKGKLEQNYAKKGKYEQN